MLADGLSEPSTRPQPPAARSPVLIRSHRRRTAGVPASSFLGVSAAPRAARRRRGREAAAAHRAGDRCRARRVRREGAAQTARTSCAHARTQSALSERGGGEQGTGYKGRQPETAEMRLPAITSSTHMIISCTKRVMPRTCVIKSCAHARALKSARTRPSSAARRRQHTSSCMLCMMDRVRCLRIARSIVSRVGAGVRAPACTRVGI